MSCKENLFKSGTTDIFKKNENPAHSFDVDKEEEEMSQEELMLSMGPTAIEEDINPKLNLDGFVDDSSDSEEEASTGTKNMSKKRKGKNTKKPLKKTRKNKVSSDGESDISLQGVS